MHLGGLDMALTKYKLGELIELCNIRNINLNFGIDDVRGVNNLKQLMPTKADLNGRDLSKFQIVNPGEFVFNHRTSRNGSKFSIAFNDENKPVICTEDYVVFKIRDDCNHLLNARWLYMFFNRPEFDRFVITNSWGSSTEFYNWEDIKSIEFKLPQLSIQQKYVDIYNAMLANQKTYEQGLEDLKLVCDAYIENLSTNNYHPIGNYIERNRKRNQEIAFKKDDVKGFNNNGEFIKPMRLFSGNISTFKIIAKGDFVYNSRINSTIKRLSIALNVGDDLIVSPAYESFYIREVKELYPFYLYMLLQRNIFAQKVLFNSFGSSTLVFGIEDLGQVEIPVPDIETQKSISDIYKIYKERCAISEKLKLQIKNICPILIKGSIEEGRRTEEA